MVREGRSYLLRFQVLNLLSRIRDVSQEDLQAINNGIANQSIKSIRVYGVDDKNHCRVGLELEINWAVQTSHVLVIGDRGAIAETVSTKNDPAPEDVNAVEVFNQTVEAGHLRTECYYHGLGVHGAPPLPELPELKLPFTSYSPDHVPSEYLQALLQHRYAVDILTQSSQRSASILTIQAMKEGEIANHVKRLQQEGDWGEGKPLQGIIFQRGSLPENFERHAKQLVEALGNEQHNWRQPAEQALQGFVVATEKPQLSSLSQASREYHLPLKSLSRWVALDLIPAKYRDKDTIYIANETLEEVARIYQEAKEQNVPPAKLLKERRASSERRDTGT